MELLMDVCGLPTQTLVQYRQQYELLNGEIKLTTNFEFARGGRCLSRETQTIIESSKLSCGTLGTTVPTME